VAEENMETSLIEMKPAVHDFARKWLNWLLSEEANKFEVFKDLKPFSVLFRELRYQIGLFPIGEKLPEREMRELFPNSDDWHNAIRFSEILNTTTDYKTVAFVILYKMKTVGYKIASPGYRDFFIVGFERLICLTE
jgi:hypothetical protein